MSIAMIQTAAGPISQETYWALIDDIMGSSWPTQDLVDFVLHWSTTGPSILAGTETGRPVYEATGARTQDVARGHFASLADPDTLRWEAAEALVIGGWTRHTINRRKS